MSNYTIRLQFDDGKSYIEQYDSYKKAVQAYNAERRGLYAKELISGNSILGEWYDEE